MKKHYRNIKDLVHINILRGDKSEVLTEDLINAEKRVEVIRQTCYNTEKKITACLQTSGAVIGGVDGVDEKRLKKLPQMQLYQCFTELAEQLGTDSVLGLTLSECSKLQNLSAKELLNYESDVEQCLSALTKATEVDIPVVNKAKKHLTKATTDMDSYRIKYHTALKLSQQAASVASVASAQKAESLRKELEDSASKVDQNRDIYAAELLHLLSKESDLSHIFLDFFKSQANYHKKNWELMQIYIPLIQRVIDDNSQKPVFGTALEEHLRVTKREISIVIETCVGCLLNNLSEEGLFRIPGSTSKVRKLKNAFDAGIVDFEEYVRDTHTVAGALKSYLRELPEPLFTYSLYHEWINAAKISDTDARLQALWKVCNKLPKANHDNLRYMIKFLSKISNNCDSNKMSSQNLAIAISPSLIWPQQDSQPFDLNMTAASNHSLILDTIIQYCDWFFPAEVNFVTFPVSVERVANGDHTYIGDHYTTKSHHSSVRSAKKPAPAPPVALQGVRPLDRVAPINGLKTHSRNNSDSLEMVRERDRDLMTTSGVDSNDETNSVDSDHNSSVIYSTASLDRPAKRAIDLSTHSSSERHPIVDRKVSTSNYQTRNKVIEKPNVPPPSVPTRSSLERPLSVHERPSVPPPERPQRSCDNKAKQRSLECLNNSDSEQQKTSTTDPMVTKVGDENESTITKSLYTPSSDLIDSSDDCYVLTSVDSDGADNSSIDSLKAKNNSIGSDIITFVDDSDVEDNNNHKYKLDANYTQLKGSKQTTMIPVKPPRSASPAPTPADRKEPPASGHQSNSDELLIDIKSTANEVSNTTTNESPPPPVSVNANAGLPVQPRPRRPLPPNKPKIAASTENTHL